MRSQSALAKVSRHCWHIPSSAGTKENEATGSKPALQGAVSFTLLRRCRL